MAAACSLEMHLLLLLVLGVRVSSADAQYQARIGCNTSLTFESLPASQQVCFEKLTSASTTTLHTDMGGWTAAAHVAVKYPGIHGHLAVQQDQMGAA